MKNTESDKLPEEKDFFSVSDAVDISEIMKKRSAHFGEHMKSFNIDIDAENMIMVHRTGLKNVHNFVMGLKKHDNFYKTLYGLRYHMNFLRHERYSDLEMTAQKKTMDHLHIHGKNNDRKYMKNIIKNPFLVPGSCIKTIHNINMFLSMLDNNVRESNVEICFGPDFANTTNNIYELYGIPYIIKNTHIYMNCLYNMCISYYLYMNLHGYGGRRSNNLYSNKVSLKKVHYMETNFFSHYINLVSSIDTRILALNYRFFKMLSTGKINLGFNGNFIKPLSELFVTPGFEGVKFFNPFMVEYKGKKLLFSCRFKEGGWKEKYRYKICIGWKNGNSSVSMNSSNLFVERGYVFFNDLDDELLSYIFVRWNRPFYSILYTPST